MCSNITSLIPADNFLNVVYCRFLQDLVDRNPRVRGVTTFYFECTLSFRKKDKEIKDTDYYPLTCERSCIYYPSFRFSSPKKLT